MSTKLGVLLVWAVLGVLFAYYLYTPFPDNAKHPIKQRFSRAAVRLMHDIVSCCFKTEKYSERLSVKKKNIKGKSLHKQFISFIETHNYKIYLKN